MFKCIVQCNRMFNQPYQFITSMDMIRIKTETDNSLPAPSVVSLAVSPGSAEPV